MRFDRTAVRRSAQLLAIPLAALLAAPSYAQFPEWISFRDVTADKLVADSEVGSGDTIEKDLIAGDLDKDGDPDLIIVRKVPFSNEGGARNVLLMNEDGVLTDLTETLAPAMMDAEAAARCAAGLQRLA